MHCFCQLDDPSIVQLDPRLAFMAALRQAAACSPSSNTDSEVGAVGNELEETRPNKRARTLAPSTPPSRTRTWHLALRTPPTDPVDLDPTSPLTGSAQRSCATAAEEGGCSEGDTLLEEDDDYDYSESQGDTYNYKKSQTEIDTCDYKKSQLPWARAPHRLPRGPHQLPRALSRADNSQTDSDETVLEVASSENATELDEGTLFRTDGGADGQPWGNEADKSRRGLVENPISEFAAITALHRRMSMYGGYC